MAVCLSCQHEKGKLGASDSNSVAGAGHAVSEADLLLDNGMSTSAELVESSIVVLDNALPSLHALTEYIVRRFLTKSTGPTRNVSRSAENFAID